MSDSIARAAVILAREPGGAYRTVAEIAADARGLVRAAYLMRNGRTARARADAIAQAERVLAPYCARVDSAEGPPGRHELRVQFTSGRYVNGRLSYYLPVWLVLAPVLGALPSSVSLRLLALL